METCKTEDRIGNISNGCLNSIKDISYVRIYTIGAIACVVNLSSHHPANSFYYYWKYLTVLKIRGGIFKEEMEFL